MKQYPGYDRKRYEKYDKKLDDNASITADEQKWLDDNKQAYQLDKLRDTLGKKNFADIKEI